ncbi:MAG: LutB/LldF family L-lactate oxidation iron-sulfur protein [Bacteroidales bacterium]|nr:LutB/LldF family L-lactate oxidation iron-sulfur protein [Bacteroidales bacterium]MDD3664110.1 LutB/LldF family L-lactate oxidation iron-sulfur protein [Bacteroidales bacterium]
MSEISETFKHDSEKKSADNEHYVKLSHNISRYDQAVKRGMLQYSNLDLARSRAGSIKYRTINDLDKYLIEFEARFTARGGKVIWAQDAREAIDEVLAVMKKYDVRKVVKSKSMITEEIELNAALKQKKIEVVETDLGEYIVQQAGQKPYHIVTPAMHMSKEEVASLFNQKFNIPADSQPEDITAYVRKLLREKFLQADCGVTGANFLIADTGSVALTENEGNGLMSLAFPRLHIVIAGIEKVIPSIEDLDLFWPLLATHGTGQQLTVYNSIISGPRQDGEADGPGEMFVVLLDNGRSALLAKEQQRQALSCIRCGACLNGCPVYTTIGGHAYGTTYSGPIGAVITPHMKGLEKWNHLSFASSLCGKCTEVCPVKIPLHNLLLQNRKDAVEAGYTSASWRRGMKLSKRMFMSRYLMDMPGSATKNFVIKQFAGKLWGSQRVLPKVAQKSFGKLYNELNS